MNSSLQRGKETSNQFRVFQGAFTLLELLVVIGTLALLSTIFTTGLARTKPYSKSTQCLNSLHQLTLAWRQYSEDNRDVLLTCESLAGRVKWVAGNLDFSSASGNWDPAIFINTSPLFPYCGGKASIFRCPADNSTVVVSNSVRVPRVRSRSMSQVFGTGAWLDKNFNSTQRVWRTYSSFSSIMQPAHTFLFLDEHPDGINDGSFASACTGNQPGDAPASSSIIDFPANYHNQGAGLSFADGRAVIHRWIGTNVGRAPITYTGQIALNSPATDSWVDMHWVAQNTTVRY